LQCIEPIRLSLRSVRQPPTQPTQNPYVDLEPGVWTKIRIYVRGEHARLYVHDQDQPTLIVNDLKTGPQGKGAVALWIDRGTVAHFRNLTLETGTIKVCDSLAFGQYGLASDHRTTC
jgi:hypothetical protein